jgi:hypothetical protein
LGYLPTSELLCDLGIKLYKEGRYDEALTEFKKALMVRPDCEPAMRYIEMINQVAETRELEEELPAAEIFPPIVPETPINLEQLMDIIQLQREMIIEKQMRVSPQKKPLLGIPLISPKAKVLPQAIVPAKKKVYPPRVMKFEDAAKKLIEIEQGKSVVLQIKNIKRYLVTTPNVVLVDKRSDDELIVTGNEFGYTYVHVWNDSGRNTIEFLTIPVKSDEPTYEEVFGKNVERTKDFKVKYSVDWTVYESGKGLRELRRNSYLYSHGLTIKGPTPYGNFDTHTSIRKDNDSTDVTYYTIGLEQGNIGPFKDFKLRGFDLYTDFTNLTYTDADLRGAMLSSPAFNKKLYYTTFWAREGGGRYGDLSPGLTKIKKSYLEGLNLKFEPDKKQEYRFSIMHGYGRDRDPFLKDFGYDLMGNWNSGKISGGYEIGYDTDKFAHLLTGRYTREGLNLNVELRDISKNFYTMTNRAWRAGEIGGLVNLSYQPTEKFNINSNLNVYKDRLYPAEDKAGRLNEDFNLFADYKFDQTTSMSLNYNIQNDLGRLSQSRYQSPGLSFAKTFKFIKDINTYLNYYHQESKNYSAPASDLVNDRIYAGLRFNIIADLYYYVNKEQNWLEEKATAKMTKPNVFETGLDWSGQIGETPFYRNVRFMYRDEEDTLSPLSYLSGEDYIEGYALLSYRPPFSDNEIYSSCRVRNIWKENPSLPTRIDLNFNLGLRYIWDTGLRWDAVGDIEGYIFKDANGDGFRERDEAPVQGVKVWLGKDKSQVTDIFGYYKFKGVRGLRVFVNLDTTTLPKGFVSTVPVTQQVNILHHRTQRVDFGIFSRSEITGIIFEDVDGDGKYSVGDKGISNAVIIMDGSKKTATDPTGRYYFRNAPTGEHTLVLDLNTLPIYYLPETAIKKTVAIFEGVVYTHNIPLKRIKQ